MNHGQQFCTFFLEGHFFGVPVQEVQEVIRYQEMTSVPLVPAAVSGLINLRGQIVTAVDLRRRLSMGERGVGLLPMNVVVRTDDGPLSLLVDEIGDVIEVDQESFEQPPETMKAMAGDVVRGVHKLQDRLLLVLDTSRAVEVGVGEKTLKNLQKSEESGRQNQASRRFRDEEQEQWWERSGGGAGHETYR